MRTPALLIAGCLAASGCNDSSAGPVGEGTIEVSVLTTGGDIDLDGYELRVDGRIGTTVEANGEETYVIRAGSHDVEITGVAANCSVGGAVTRTVTVAAGEAASIDFVVTCRTTGIRVSASSAGVDLDPSGYLIKLDGVNRGSVAANGQSVLSRLAPGDYTVEVAGLTPNCQLDGSPTRTVTVTNGEVTLAIFNFSCVATYGVIKVEVVTTGERPDANYVAEWRMSPAAIDPPLGQVTVLDAAPAYITQVTGVRYVRLAEVAPNCAVEGGDQREISVLVGGSVRDTAVVSFEVSCVTGNATLRFITTTTGSEAPAEFIANLYAGGCTDPYYCDPYEHQAVAVAPNGVTSFLVLSDTYTLYFDAGITCRWEQNFYQSVSLAPGANVDVALEVYCERPLIRVTAPTTGSNPDTEYTVTLFYYDFYYGSYQIDLGALAAGGTLEARVFSGFSWVQLGGVAGNCSVGVANPTAPFTLDWGQVLELSFPVTCGP